ncbi:FitA-like ribbon-helix-helix domain-containing protein [Nesterenkonia muleiensis]|uniref:FitA-like ribbon-helix-helix domain-containing protein n=1 Tax=Nesterenkonia muleiensis TaxID=2282648 RepID=UPI000E72D82A|nr:hypothetical protein [Nesterenkonia muleiensis]
MTMIQLRNVPEETHRALKVRAAQEGLSLSDYARKELEKLVERPTAQELLERLAALPPVEPSESPAEAVRAEREAR